jgi:hypothetical protein
MKTKSISVAVVLLVLSVTLTFATRSLAGSIMIFKGSTINEAYLESIINLPNNYVISLMDIQIATWGIYYTDEDVLIYNLLRRTLSQYQYSTIFTLPGLDETVVIPGGEVTTIRELIERFPFIIFHTDLGMIELPETVPTGGPVVTCPGDFNIDFDVDGSDLAAYISDQAGISLSDFAVDFGKTDCP